MSERVLIALIGIIPSALVAIVSIISNNVVLKLRIDQLQKQMDHVKSCYDGTDLMRCISHEQLTTHTMLKELVKRVEKLEQESNNG